MYSIKAVSQATGLSVEALRAWERRYGVVVPQRDDLGRRVYRPEDVLRLRRLREATDRGHPIGRLSRLGDEALAALLEDAHGDPDQTVVSNAFVERILEAVQRFRSADCDQALTLAVAMLPPSQLTHEVLRPLLREVGDRWQRGELSIAQERMISSSVRKHVGLALDAYERCAHRPPVVFATLPGERHELGLLMAATFCATKGFKAHYLGVDLPPEETARFAREVNAAAVAISVVLTDSVQAVPGQLQVLSRHLGPDRPIWLGGSGSKGLSAQELPPSCVLVQDDFELQQRLEMLAA